MARSEENIFKKGYTDFDERLDRELEEEKDARRKQLLLQAPDYKLLNWMAEQGEETEELAAKLKDAGLYYLRSKRDEETDKLMGVFRKTIVGCPSVRGEILKQVGLLGCLAFKQEMPALGKGCGQIILEDLRLLGNEDPELSGEGYLYLRNVADTAARTRHDRELQDIVNAFYAQWSENPVPVNGAILSALADLLFVTADRRQMDILLTVCRMSRRILRHPTADFAMRQHFVMEWSRIAAQIAQRGWVQECTLLLKELCLFLGKVRDFRLIRKALADFSLHMQIQCKWDGFESALRLYEPCQWFAMTALFWALRRYRHIGWQCTLLEEGNAHRDASMLEHLEQKMKLVSEQEDITDLIRFLLRNARDMAAGCARLLMKDEWEIYLIWQRFWITSCGKSDKRRQQVRFFMELTAEYWHSTQPSRSRKQWEKMKEITNPSLLSRDDTELLAQLA